MAHGQISPFVKSGITGDSLKSRLRFDSVPKRNRAAARAPFQYNRYVAHADGTIQHREFLHDGPALVQWFTQHITDEE